MPNMQSYHKIKSMSIDYQNSARISHFLGIDYGKADVGLALADEETKIAFAYKTLKNDKNFLQNLAEIIENENVKTVIIGIPSYIYPHTNLKVEKNKCHKRLSGSIKREIGVGVNRKEVEYDGEKLGKLLEKNLKIEVEYQNEMFTTKLAQHYLIERGVKGIKRLDDQEAARIILQEWIDND